MITAIAVIVAIVAVFVLMVAVVEDMLHSPRRLAGRPVAPGSLPQARGFDAAAERHFGNPGVGRCP